MGKAQGGTAAGHIGEQFAFKIMRQGADTRKKVFQQLTEALATGNIEARMPIIQNMVETGLQQASGAQRMAEEDIAKSGAGRSPAASELRAGLRAMSTQAVSQIPANVIGQTIQGGPDALSGATASAMGMLGQANLAAGAANAAKAQNQATTMSAAGAGVGVAVAIIAAI
jgi:hypothetical protein